MASFSAPLATTTMRSPSRQSSLRGASGAGGVFDPRDTFARGGLALNPPSEKGESVEDLSAAAQQQRQVTSPPRRQASDRRI